MIIEEKDFRLTSNSEHSIFFDVELLYKIQPKGKEARLEFKNVAYGISLEAALKKVIQYRINCKHDTMKLKEYLEAFKNEWQAIKNYLNESSTGSK